MSARQPTAKQLLILADRAERGLTPAEQDRLRSGIQALEFARRSAAAHASQRQDEQTRARRQLAAVHDLVRRARYRGARTVTVWALDQVLDTVKRPGVATGSGAATPRLSAGDAPSRAHSGP